MWMYLDGYFIQRIYSAIDSYDRHVRVSTESTQSPFILLQYISIA
jgi:hypothetical protein